MSSDPAIESFALLHARWRCRRTYWRHMFAGLDGGFPEGHHGSEHDLQPESFL